MRIILIEPNLTGTEGHPTEFSKNLFNYARSKDIKCVLVCNRQIDKNTKKLFGNFIFPLITHSCFANLSNDSGVLTFLNDLKQIDKQLKLNDNDVIVVLTSYTNEIRGGDLFLHSRNDLKHPKFYFWVHQLFPPESDFLVASQKARKEYWINRFTKYCDNLHKNIQICSTTSIKLKEKIENLIHQKVIMLPLPYNIGSLSYPSVSNKSEFTVSFLGDGRFEKGVILFLESVWTLKDENLMFCIQDANWKGFSDKNIKRLGSLLKSLSENKNFILLPKNLSQKSFIRTIKDSSLLVFPYNPNSYHMRVSGLLVQTLLSGVPALVSSETWLDEEIRKNNIGTSFKYDKENEKKSVNNLSQSIKYIAAHYHQKKGKALVTSKKYKDLHSPKIFFKTLLSVT